MLVNLSKGLVKKLRKVDPAKKYWSMKVFCKECLECRYEDNREIRLTIILPQDLRRAQPPNIVKS